MPQKQGAPEQDTLARVKQQMHIAIPNFMRAKTGPAFEAAVEGSGAASYFRRQARPVCGSSSTRLQHERSVSLLKGISEEA